MVLTISLDSGCLNAKGRHPVLNSLEQLSEEGRIQLCASETVHREQSRTEVDPNWRERYSNKLKGTQHDSETTYFPFRFPARFESAETKGRRERIVAICFPGRCFENLTPNQKNDVRMLEAHQAAERNYFITKNTRDFINKGKKEQLAEIGIYVREPNAAFLHELEQRLHESP